MDLMRARGAVLVALALAGAACAGASHRKPVGPPPEYEVPQEPDGWPPPAAAAARARDPGARDAGSE